MNIYLDIETAPDKSNEKLIQNFLDKAKETSRTSAVVARQKIEDEFALHPLTGKIISLCTISSEDNESSIILNCQGDEFSILTRLSESLANFNSNTFITFNGSSFDIPFLQTRAALHGIDIPSISCDRYCRGNHLDLYQVLNNYNPQGKGTLDDWCDFFGITVEDDVPVKGYMIPVLYQTGQMDLIAKHNLADVRKLQKLHQKVVPLVLSRT